MKEELRELLLWREADAGDLNFVLSGFLKGLYYGNKYFKNIDKDIFYKNYQLIIKSILSRPSVKIIICCLKEDQKIIIGFSIIEGVEILHWVNVKRVWRLQGVALSLVPMGLKFVTHLTEPAKTLMKKYEQIKYNPFL